MIGYYKVGFGAKFVTKFYDHWIHKSDNNQNIAYWQVSDA